MIWQPPRMHRNLGDPVTRFQVLGARNSGTNFVSRLVERNFEGLEPAKVYRWKHGFVDRRLAAQPGLLTLVVYRHPIRWIQSVHHRPLNLGAEMHGLPFGAFIRHEWRGVFPDADGEREARLDLDPKTRARFPNALALRNRRIGYLERLAGMPGQVAFLRFEDVNRDPRATLAALARGFELSARPFTGVKGWKGFGERAYVPRQMPPVRPDDMAFIRAELDLAQEARIGYRLEDLPRFDGLPAWDSRSLRSLARAALRPSRSGGMSRRETG